MLMEYAAVAAAAAFATKVVKEVVQFVVNEARYARQEAEEKVKQAEYDFKALAAEAQAKVESEAHKVATEAHAIATEVKTKVDALYAGGVGVAKDVVATVEKAL